MPLPILAAGARKGDRLDNALHQNQAGPGGSGLPDWMRGLGDMSGYMQQLQNPSAQPGEGIAAPGASPNTLNLGGGMPLGAPSVQGGPTNPYNIDGRLDFGASGANFDFSGNPASLSTNYANTYMDALRLNAQNYGNIMGGYNQTMNNQLAAQDQLNQNYTGLGDRVQGLIAGTDRAQMQRINDQYNQSMGTMQQGAINRGLGNTTVTNALARGIESDRAQEQTNVQNQFAQLQAGYMSNIGLAGLNQQGNNILANTGLAGRQLNFMEGVSAPYPNPALYAQLGQQLGQGQQGAQDRQRILDQIGQVQRAGQQGAGVPGLNAGGGGGVRQSAFGPSAGNSSQTPGYGPGIGSGGGGFSSGAGGVGARISTGGNSGYRSTTTGYPAPGSGGRPTVAPGASSPWSIATGYPGPGNSQREADYSNYDDGSGLFGGIADWATGASGGGYDPYSGYTYDDLYGTDLGYDNSQGYSWDDLYGTDVTGQNYGNDWYDLSFEDAQYGGYYDDSYTPTDGGWYDNTGYSDPYTGSYDLSNEDSAYGGWYDWSGYYGGGDYGYSDPGYSLNDLYGSDVTGGGYSDGDLWAGDMFSDAEWDSMFA